MNGKKCIIYLKVCKHTLGLHYQIIFLSFSNYCINLNRRFMIAAEEYWKKLNNTLAWTILKNLALVFPTITMEISEKKNLVKHRVEDISDVS